MPRPTPGLAPPIATVKLRVSNTGNTHLKRLTVTDRDADGATSDFFDSFDVVGLDGVSFPPGADLVQVDVCTTGCDTDTWVLGTPTNADTPPFPAGVTPADVRGIRVTFTSSDPAHGGFNLLPGSDFPTSGPCPQASICLDVTPRTTNASDGSPVLGTYQDTASAQGESPLTLGGPFDIPPVTAEVGVVEGRPAIDVEKSVVGAANVAPGQIVLFDLQVVNTGTAALPDLVVTDPIPPELRFSETGVGGQPYDIVTFDVPAGTTPPGPETFVAETNPAGDVTRLVWRFPGRFEVGSRVVIRIGMTLAGGVQAGQQVDNTMGAGSSSTDDFDCSGAPPDGIVVGAPYDDGQSCTDPASVTTSPGAAFEARKWVAGNATLGWFHSTDDAFVPIGDPAAPAWRRTASATPTSPASRSSSPVSTSTTWPASTTPARSPASTCASSTLCPSKATPVSSTPPTAARSGAPVR